MIANGALALLCAIVAVFAPWLVSDFWVFVFIEMLVFALYAVTFNLLLGYGGMLAFGHAVFFGIGAYALAILMKKAALGRIPAALLAPCAAARRSDHRLFLHSTVRHLSRDADVRVSDAGLYGRAEIV